ncbi:outer membrane beta-barrel protein [Rheinheimera sp. 1928-s]|uniref:outer membrane beta-barrel protein n=1 Tax=Rheinheimera sp. 1928-s TaxID=3033803 RepID=UPI00263773B6|nr:outer membrane beta-barrel protein [Rheinheimera sp. 1928-s]MDF3125690.1 outer membrane beta-barrel protein [Rheinheimera sp. 1928-s]
MKSKLAVMVALACASSQVFAVEPQSIQTGSGFDITPLLTTGLKFDDNITSSSANEIDSWILTAVPSVKAVLDDGVTKTEFSAALFNGTYLDSSDDNFTDTMLGALFDTQLSEQGKFNAKADFVWGHEDRGTGITEGLSNSQDEPTRFNNQTVSGYYEYGAQAAPARVRFGAKYFNKEYMNQREVTQFRDYDSVLGGVNFYYDTLSGTTAVLETSIEDTSYDFVDPTAPRDSKDSNVKVGAEWQISALTSGEAKIGYQKKDFDDSAREDFSGVSWIVNATWSPLTYSNINVGTGRKAKDPLQGGDYIKETTYVVGWSHNWTDAMQTNLSYNRMEEDYVGISRKDENDSYTASVKYAFRRFVDVTLFTTVTDKTSSVQGIEFDRNITGLSFDFSL